MTSRREALKCIAGISLPLIWGQSSTTRGRESSDDIHFLSASRMAKMIRNKEVSSRELVQAHLTRIAAVNHKVNAIVELVADQALERADLADTAISRGRTHGSLHGVPVTIKDSFETAGIRTTCGTLGLKNNVPARNATAVQRLIDAGAIVLGKTNTPELTLSYETDNLAEGRTLNPYHEAHIAGGSSGGEAAAIACGASPLGLGSDTAGSIRYPAYCCGIAGLAPTWGRVPISGLIDAGGFQNVYFTVAGPMARSVEDLYLGLTVMAGPDVRDPFSFPAPLRDYRLVNLSQLRVAFHTDNGSGPCARAIENAIRIAANSLADGPRSRVEETRPDAIKVAYELAMSVYTPNFAASIKEKLDAVGTKMPSKPVQEVIKHVDQFDRTQEASVQAQWRKTQREWYAYRIKLLEFFEQYDVVLCAPHRDEVPKHGGTLPENFHRGAEFTVAYGLAGLPVVVVRCGESNGLPVGVQIVCRPWREDLALAVAAYLERQDFGGWRPPPI